MLWTFSDGTRFELGGKVEGTGVFADQLRLDVDAVRDGDRVLVSVHTPDMGMEALDLSVPHLVAAWIHNVARRYRVATVSAPKVKRPSPPGWNGGEHG